MITDLTRKRYQEFAELVQARGDSGRWLVLTHDNPDPDAIASAAVLADVLRHAFSRRVTIAYGGIIGRAENQEMVRSLHLRMSHLRHLAWGNYRHFALVDTQPGTGNNQLPAATIPELVFDHHPPRSKSASAAFVDIRPQYGATATLLAEYLMASGVAVTTRIATASIYAIRAETQDFGREFAGPDKQVFDDLLPQADRRLLAKIQTPRLPLSYFRNLHQALESLEGVGTLVVSHLGEVEQPDIVPEVADLLLRLEGKTWSLCTGLFGDRVYLSLRTTNPRADAGHLMRRLLARRGKGGGHGMTAGGWVEASRAPGGDTRALQRQLASALAEALRKDPQKIQSIPLAAPPPADAPQS